MEVILLEKVKGLGIFGDTVNVKNGYGRNFLIPQNKALLATEKNMEVFKTKKAEIEVENKKKLAEANKLGEKINNEYYVITRQSSDDGRLYGSVSSKDIVDSILQKSKVEINRAFVVLKEAFKYTGVFEIEIALHSDAHFKINLVIARTDSEADDAIKANKKAAKKEGEGEEVAA